MENKQSFQNVLFKAIYENSENKLFKESFDPEHLEEGWKDNLKKGLATAAVAGSLMTGNAQAAQNPMDWEGAQEKGQFTAFADEDRSPIADLYQTQNNEEDIDALADGGDGQTSSYNDLLAFANYEGYKLNNDGTFTGSDGKNYSEKQLREIMLYGEIQEAVDVIEPRYEDDSEAENDNEEDWYQMWQDSQLQTDENEHFLDYIKRLRDNY